MARSLTGSSLSQCLRIPAGLQDRGRFGRPRISPATATLMLFRNATVTPPWGFVLPKAPKHLTQTTQDPILGWCAALCLWSLCLVRPCCWPSQVAAPSREPCWPTLGPVRGIVRRGAVRHYAERNAADGQLALGHRRNRARHAAARWSVVGSWAGGSSSVTSGSINWDPLSADGKSFTGTSSYGSETRSWGGVCVSGACASNGTANPCRRSSWFRQRRNGVFPCSAR